MSQTFIPLSVPNLHGNELTYITDAIEQEWVSTAGSYITAFEQQFSLYIKTPNAVAVQSGTAGIHLALLAKKVGPTQAVLVPTLTFIAAVNPVHYVGAMPIFMDCDDSLCMDMQKVELFCKNECDFDGQRLIHRTSGKHVSSMIIVHVFGNIADMEKALVLSEKYHIALIEDATEALGSYITSGKLAGQFAGTIGDIGIYSFNGNKIITTGGGGMLVAKDSKILNYMHYLSTQAKEDAFTFFHREVGYNYRMTNIQAAIGLAQLEQLESFIQTKKQNYELYKKNGISLIDFRHNIRPNYWFYSYICNNRDKGIEYLAEQNIQTRPIWHLIHTLPPYLQSEAYQIEIANIYLKNVVNIPCSSNLKKADVNYVSDIIKKFEQKIY